MAHLTSLSGPLKGREIKVLPRMVFGRAPGLSVTLDDPKVSRQHAEIVKRGSAYLIADMKSGNGTHVNGERVAGEAVLKGGDEIRVGASVFVFHEKAATETGRPAAGTRAQLSPVAVVLFAFVLAGIVYFSKIAAMQLMKLYGF